MFVKGGRGRADEDRGSGVSGASVTWVCVQAGVLGLTKTVAREYSGRGITCYPGFRGV